MIMAIRYDEPFRLTATDIDESPFPPLRGLAQDDSVPPPALTAGPSPTERIATVIRNLRAKGLNDDQVQGVIDVIAALEGDVIDPDVLNAAFALAGPPKRRFPVAEIVCVVLGLAAGGIAGYMFCRGRRETQNARRASV